MKITILTGGVGGAKFLLGAREFFGNTPFPATTTSESTAESLTHSSNNHVSAIVNVGDDAWMHGIRIAPDLDSCMYTLGGGIDVERGWGRDGETFQALQELAAYQAEPNWFGLGDKDLATHLIRTHMLSAGYPLSQVTEALCRRWNPGVELIPASDDRHETHVIVSTDSGQTREAIHFQQWWIKHRANIPTFGFVQVDSEKSRPAPLVLERIANADVILIAPSNPVVSIASIISVPGIRAALRSAQAPIIGFSPVITGKALRGMAEQCLTAIGYGSSTRDVAEFYGARKKVGLLDGWLIDTADTPAQESIAELGIAVRAVPLIMSDPQATSLMIEAGIQLAGSL